MKIKIRAFAVLAPLLLSPLWTPSQSTAATSPARSVPEAEAFVTWARAHALPIATVEPGGAFDDLRPLKGIVGRAPVVALGESGHDFHEFLSLRNRFFEFLAQEMNFTAIALETGFFEGARVDDYVCGGTDDRLAVAQDVFMYGGQTPSEENVHLIDWMRTRNARTPGRKLHFYGIDLSGGDGERGEFLRARRSIDAAVAYLERCDTTLARQFRQELEPRLAMFDDRNYQSLSPSERNALTGSIADLVSVLERRRIDFLALTQEVEYERAFHNAAVARQLDAFFRAKPDSTVKEADYRDAMMARDAAMAENLRWALEREGVDGRILLFAHNGHVQKIAWSKPAYVEFFPGKPNTPMGAYLRSTLGDKMVVFGSAFGRVGGESKAPLAAPVSVDGELARIGKPLFVVDLRAVPAEGGASDWLMEPRPVRVNDRYAELIPRSAFDALVFVDSLSDVRPIPGTQEGPR